MMAASTKKWSDLKGLVFFTSDTHYGHKNIIGFCDRPFADLGAMEDGLVSRHNAIVGPEDTIIYIGDFAMGQSSKWAGVVARLNGYKILVRGNHDRTHSKMLSVGFDEVFDSLTLTDTAHGTIYCEHVPCLLHQADIHLCGHVHERWETHTPRIVNVGVDVNGLMPRSLEELVLKLDAESNTPQPQT